MRPACVTDYREQPAAACPACCSTISTAAPTPRRRCGGTSRISEALALRQRVMRDVSNISLETELFGQKMAMPMVLSPIGMGGMYARRGEVRR